MNWFAELTLHDGVLSVYPGVRLWHATSGAARLDAFAALNRQRAGPHGWLPGQGGLVANLRVWENCLLPAAYFQSRSLVQEEQRFQGFLDDLQIDQSERAMLSRATVAMLTPRQRRQALMLRTLMAAPEMILIETEWLQMADDTEAGSYVDALGKHCPHAAWIALGPQRPAAIWRINPAKEPADAAIA
ncbi:hypothetical protein [Chitinimonas sp. BJYL2]|uniref:hypothetical protein n=1 Tax=Chitinimonas sp. BJYL2 TaxID=2976696 RepID=UPI0022B32F82|nr:hypothetical protein [Chitinimonas sp. BJYL2]